MRVRVRVRVRARVRVRGELIPSMVKGKLTVYAGPPSMPTGVMKVHSNQFFRPSLNFCARLSCVCNH